MITIALLLAMIYRHTHQQKLDVQQLARTTAFMIVCVLLLSTGPALEMLAQWLVISISGQYPMPLSRLVQAFWLPKNLLMSVYFGSFVGAITAYAAFVAKPKYRLFTTAVAATAAMVAYDLYIQLARDVHAQLSREGLLEPGFFGSVAADVIGGPIAAWIVVYIFGARLPGSLARNQRDPNAVIARGGKRNARGRRGAGKRRHDMR